MMNPRTDNPSTACEAADLSRDVIELHAEELTRLLIYAGERRFSDLYTIRHNL